MKKRKEKTWLLFFLILFAGVGLLGSWNMLRENADYMGRNLAESYAIDEEQSIETYKKMVQIGMSYIDEQAAEGETFEELEKWIVGYFAKTRESMNGNVADAYGVIDGKTVAAVPWEGIEHYDYASKLWYRQAMEAGGQPVFTNLYTDSVYGENVVTVAAANPDTGNAVAFDLFPENFERSHQSVQLLENSAYYVCDGAGKLIYRRTPFELSEEEADGYIEELYGRITAGEMEDGGHIWDTDGVRREVYYYRTINGWLCILTIPLEALHENLYRVYFSYLAIGMILLVTVVLIGRREQRIKRDLERKNDTIQMIGNSYYAMYRIIMGDGTYEMIKGSEYVLQRLPHSGRYQALLNVLISCIKEETREEFAKSFSMENILLQAEKKTVDYGGDFLRLFGDEYRWVNVRLVQDPVNSPGEAVLCFREVEEEKQRQLQSIQIMEEALASAEASEKSQKQFFSNMSHDMRTPLNVIIGMAELGQREECSREKMVDYLQKIGASSQQLLTLINDILEMSRLEQGKIDLENSTFNLCDTLESCVAPFRIQAQNEGKAFEVETKVSAPVVCGDALRLTQILNNLISNAVKFTERGDSITVTLEQVKNSRHGRYVFTVEDTGRGMSEEFLPRLFEPYERERTFGAQNVAGTGLGMPIVKNLVSQMSGEITVDSALGRGTRFSVILPFSVSSKEELPQKEKADFTELKGRRILLAEDNLLNTEIVKEFLSMEGMEHRAVENGREALEAFEESKPGFYDAILMDMQMPEMDGCEAAERIRALGRRDAKKIPIIALTANAFPEDIARTAAAGMDAHLSKPIEPELLYGTLQQLMAQRKSE